MEDKKEKPRYGDVSMFPKVTDGYESLFKKGFETNLKKMFAELSTKISIFTK